MFTGIVSGVAGLKIKDRSEQGITLAIERPASWTDLAAGESVSVNGACLTVQTVRDKEFDCFVVPETLHKTSFGKKMPERVNLERALKVSDRFGGHFVQGHVDEMGTVVSVDSSDGMRIDIQFSPDRRDLIIYKGSIAVDGVSLTVAAVTDHTLQIALIPHTLQTTTFSDLRPGDEVNLEFDILGKYVLNGIHGEAKYAARS